MIILGVYTEDRLQLLIFPPKIGAIFTTFCIDVVDSVKTTVHYYGTCLQVYNFSTIELLTVNIKILKREKNRVNHVTVRIVLTTGI